MKRARNAARPKFLPDAAYLRASFRDLKASENGLGVRVPCAVDVEIFRSSGQLWKVRSRSTGQVFLDISPGFVEYVRDRVAAKFETQTSPWTWTDGDGLLCSDPYGNRALRHLAQGTSSKKPPGQLAPGESFTACGAVVLSDRVFTEPEKVNCSECLAARAR